MPAFICVACGSQYPNTETPPSDCVICGDDSHYVDPQGQARTTRVAMRTTHFNAFRRPGPGLMGIGTLPAFGLGQPALPYSYSNQIPLDAVTVSRIPNILEAWPFETIYGGWWDRVIPAGARQLLDESVSRYIGTVNGEAEVARYDARFSGEEEAF